MLWVGVGGHRSLLMGMVWVRVQIKRKMLGSAGEEAGRKRLNLTYFSLLDRKTCQVVVNYLLCFGVDLPT